VDTGLIRNGTQRDKDAVLRMAKKFYSECGYEAHIEYDYDSCSALYEMCLDMGLCSVAEVDGELVGFVIGLKSPFLMNQNYSIGAEVAWWVEPEHRGLGLKLLRHIEQSAKDQGLKMWSMMCLESMEPEKVSEIYLKSGYKPTERSFTRYH
jgi:GNAT superfamily N-acetyltransferase